jgi:hypothetical protein
MKSRFLSVHVFKVDSYLQNKTRSFSVSVRSLQRAQLYGIWTALSVRVAKRECTEHSILHSVEDIPVISRGLFMYYDEQIRMCAVGSLDVEIQLIHALQTLPN